MELGRNGRIVLTLVEAASSTVRGIVSHPSPCQAWHVTMTGGRADCVDMNLAPVSNDQLRFSGKLPTYPSPKPTICSKWAVLMLAKGRDRALSSLCILYFQIPHDTLCFPLRPQISHKVLCSNAPGSTAYSQEHLTTITYANVLGANREYYGLFEKSLVWRFFFQIICLSHDVVNCEVDRDVSTEIVSWLAVSR